MPRTVVVGTQEIRIEGRVLRLARIAGEGYLFLDTPETLIQAIREQSLRVDVVTFMQSIAARARVYPYPSETDNFAAVPLSTFEHWWSDQIGRKTRNMVRLAEKKGVVCRETPFDDDLARRIKGVYDETLVRQGKPNVHYGKSLDTVRREHATFLDRSVFVGAFLGEEMIGFVKLTWDQAGTQAGMMNIVSMVREREKAPSNALIAEAVRFCARRGIPYLVYARYVYGSKNQGSLIDFKKHNGFVRVDVPRYYVPLTRLGQIGLRLGLHKSVGELLPEAALARARHLRTWWYGLRLNQARRHS